MDLNLSTADLMDVIAAAYTDLHRRGHIARNARLDVGNYGLIHWNGDHEQFVAGYHSEEAAVEASRERQHGPDLIKVADAVYDAIASMTDGTDTVSLATIRGILPKVRKDTIASALSLLVSVGRVVEVRGPRLAVHYATEGFPASARGA